VVLADVEQDRLHPLLLDHLAVHQRHLVGVLVERDGGVEVLDRDTDVVNPGEHARPSLVGGPPSPPARDGGSRSPAPQPVGRGAYRLARKEAAVL
jgi:hypothetical protein